jgi:hypothetical protein
MYDGGKRQQRAVGSNTECRPDGVHRDGGARRHSLKERGYNTTTNAPFEHFSLHEAISGQYVDPRVRRT